MVDGKQFKINSNCSCVYNAYCTSTTAGVYVIQ
jgi:hypothetical protein